MLLRLINHAFDGQTATLRNIRGQYTEHLVKVVGIQVERCLGSGFTRQQTLAHLSVEQVWNILHNHFLHTGDELWIAEVAGYTTDGIIRLKFQIVLRRVVCLRLGGNLELAHLQRVAIVAEQQAVQDYITVDMVDVRAEEVDVQS